MNPRKRFLRIFLEKLPAFQALFRAVEAEAITSYDLGEPILDVGCGDGIFSEALWGKKREVWGIDINQAALAQARKRAVYKKLVRQKIQNQPFKDGQFKTVLANSILEHIGDLKPALREIAKVLAKGGVLVLTAPSEKRKQLYAGYRLFTFLKMPNLASQVGDLENKLFHHLHCWSGKKWQKELAKIGFRKISYQYKGSPKTALISDLLLIFAPIGFLEKKIFGRYLGWRKYFAPLVFLFLRGFEDKIREENGSVIVVRAEK
ncbi:MAG: class I SAM-dependent methyltransferase [Candidatus Marinimicrobia bacterium]|nr:class I SAM-dependent methyltransferase [Candidatus Neomarinimicrobiota bacterium]